MKKHFQTDELQKYIDWDQIMKMPRYAGGHDHQMIGLFKNVTVIAHWNEGNYQGEVATCVQFNDGKYKDYYAIYNDYYGSCSGCDSWEDASDDEIRAMCIGLSNGTYVFEELDDVKQFLQLHDKDDVEWSSWSESAKNLLSHINTGTIDNNVLMWYAEAR